MSVVTLDLEFTRANLDRDCTLVRALIEIAVEDLVVLATDLRSAFDGNETEKLRRLAHAIKGLASNFRAEPLMELTRKLEESSLAIQMRSLEDLVDEIYQACSCTALALSIELNLIAKELP